MGWGRGWRWVALCGALCMGISPVAHADYDAGVLAYDSGKYEDALAEFRPLIAGGHPGAEFMVGAMYCYGKGTPRDDALAAAWFHKAAYQGHPGAQLAYGSLHIRGHGVLQDLGKAYMWLTLAMSTACANRRSCCAPRRHA